MVTRGSGNKCIIIYLRLKLPTEKPTMPKKLWFLSRVRLMCISPGPLSPLYEPARPRARGSVPVSSLQLQGRASEIGYSSAKRQQANEVRTNSGHSQLLQPKESKKIKKGISRPTSEVQPRNCKMYFCGADVADEAVGEVKLKLAFALAESVSPYLQVCWVIAQSPIQQGTVMSAAAATISALSVKLAISGFLYLSTSQH